MRVLVFLLSALLLTGWGGCGKLQPDLPPADGAVLHSSCARSLHHRHIRGVCCCHFAKGEPWT